MPRRWLQRLARPGTGPGEALRRRGRYTAETYTTTTTSGAPGDLLPAAGRLQWHRRSARPVRPWRWPSIAAAWPTCGVLTPAAAMGEALLSRLPSGVTMNTVRLSR
nr:hypothetical protein [Mycobacterium tilburgii]